jgi:AraC family transcriptional regulator, transcriptional activator of pobA
MGPTEHAPDLALLRMVPIPRLAQGGKWRVEAMRSYSSPLLLWFTRGQGRITAGGVTRGYGPHNLIFLPAGTMHAFELGAHVHGTALFLPRGGSDIRLPDRIVHLRLRDAVPQGEMSAQVDALQRELDGQKPERAHAVRYHLGLLSVWLERQIQAGASSPAMAETAAVRLARAFTERLERDFRSGRTVADYAAELGVTPTHLSRVCRETCGRPASSLLHDRQLFEARRLLAETRLPVQDIAAALGFGSAAYFTRAFQSRTGKTPTAFRRTG